MSAITVESLFIYPIKSCHPLRLQTSSINRLGMAHDRLFSFAQLTSSLPTKSGSDEYKASHTWTMITQRSVPFLTKVRTEVWVPDPKSTSYDPEGEWVKNGGCLVISFPYAPSVDFSGAGIQSLWKIVRSWPRQPRLSFRIPLDPSAPTVRSRGYKLERMAIWKDAPLAWDMGCEIPADILARFKYAMGVSNPLTLFRVHPGHLREVFRNAPRKEEVGYQPVAGFQDAVSVDLLCVGHDIPYTCHGSTICCQSRIRCNMWLFAPTC